MLTRHVVITGAAQGLGRAIAKAFVGQGYSVAVTDINLAAAEKTVDELLEHRIDAAQSIIPMQLDVTKKQDFITVRDDLIQRWGSIEAVINNAAITETTALMDISTDEFVSVSSTNQLSVFLSCQVFGEYFKQIQYGRIVNLSSLAGQNGGTATGAHYAASKGAIITLTKVFAKEFAPFNITVNAIAPGPHDSPAVASIPKEKLNNIINTIPVKTLGNLDFLGNVSCLLCSDEASFTTGATWDVNGGLWMR